VSGNGRPPGQRRGRAKRKARWLRPGVGIKRWLVLVFVGELLLALAAGLVMRQLYRDLPPAAR
jgi:hypothetical protein